MKLLKGAANPSDAHAECSYLKGQLALALVMCMQRAFKGSASPSPSDVHAACSLLNVLVHYLGQLLNIV